MDTNRRDMLKLGTSAAIGGLLMPAGAASAQDRQPIVVEPMTGKAGFRIANYLPKMGATSRLGLVTNDGLVVKEYPKVPVLFTKGTQTMNGPFDNIPYDGGYSTQIDWEAELAVIIGKKGKNISEESAMDYVFGYSAYNDTTARDVQQKRHSGQWFKGKSLDGHGPMGPWVVTAGGVDLDDTRIICRVNGVEKQNASYKQMFFKIPVIISELSRSLTLLPGDIIATGTPSGVGFGRTPQEFLKPGDMMETQITGVGIIRNKIA